LDQGWRRGIIPVVALRHNRIVSHVFPEEAQILRR
jgi:hypothetical protein